jgi:hypothetical protein
MNDNGPWPQSHTSIFRKHHKKMKIKVPPLRANQYIIIFPEGENVKSGQWIVDTYNGYFIITSNKRESKNIYFSWLYGDVIN